MPVQQSFAQPPLAPTMDTSGRPNLQNIIISSFESYSIISHSSFSTPSHAPSPQIPSTPIANPIPLTPHLTNSAHCNSLALFSTSSPFTSPTSSSATPPAFTTYPSPPLAAAARLVHSRYGCLTRAGLSAKAASRDALARAESVRTCRVARRVVCESVWAAGLAEGSVRSEGRDCVERV